MKTIDNEEVLNSYYKNRRVFVVQYDPKYVAITMVNGEVRFELIKRDNKINDFYKMVDKEKKKVLKKLEGLK